MLRNAIFVDGATQGPPQTTLWWLAALANSIRECSGAPLAACRVFHVSLESSRPLSASGIDTFLLKKCTRIKRGLCINM